MLLILTQTFAPAKGGMETYMTGLAESLAKAGLAVTVFADAKKPAATKPAHLPYTVKRFSGWRPLRRWNKRRAISALRGVDGVFCDSWKSVEALPKKFSAPIVVLAHGAEYPPSPSSRKKRRIESALARATTIVANSIFTADAVRAYLKLPDDERLTVIHPPVDPLPPPTPEAQAAISALIGARAPVISVLARLEPRKGIDHVIKAMPNILAQHPNAVFLVGGDGDDAPRLRALTRAKGLDNHVEFLGYLDADKKAALFQNSDVFAMPVRRVGASVEGFGIVYIEAAYFGVPSLGGRDSGAEDAIIDGKTGALCDGDNPSDVAEKLLRMLNDEPHRCFLAQAARLRANAEFPWPKALTFFLSALKP